MTEATARPGRALPRVAARALVLSLALLGAGLAGCALPGPVSTGSAAPAAETGITRAFDRVELAGAVRDVEWHLPAGEVRAWVLLQHGFTRRCAHLRGTAAALAAEGVATLCVNADDGTGMAAGAPALAAALARWWLSPAARSPDGRTAPGAAVVAGHSAGGLFAAHVGAALAAGAPAAPVRLHGAILFDPVGAAALARSLQALRAAGAPVHATLAPPSRCNAGQLARPALERAGAVLDEPSGATHADVEGEDSDAVAAWACGRPDPARVQALRRWAAASLAALLSRAGPAGSP